jgi:S-adenosylmethionine:tRNA ribosyltransferase-isomerase
MPDLHSLSSYHFELPEELIAQFPLKVRDQSRLMVVDRKSGNLSEMTFRDLTEFLEAGDSLVFNDTKVIPARLMGRRKQGGLAEVFLTRPLTDDLWEVLVRPGRKLPVHSMVYFADDFFCEMIEALPDGRRVAKMHYEGDFMTLLQKYGQMPLPHYIKREAIEDFDEERYQTVFAQAPGAVAAPTAGLHFTTDMLEALEKKGVSQTQVTLHVGLGTFRPVQAENITQHVMHSERFFITEKAAVQLNKRSNQHRQICVGTTCCRTLESAALENGKIQAGQYETDIFIYPGYQFKYVQHLITNFHLPGSSLLMLVSAFAGYELIMEAYAKAVKDRYRFFSYGDAMLII